MASTVKVQPYGGPPENHPTNLGKSPDAFVVTTQEQLPKWESLKFLEPLGNIRMVETNGCWPCGRRKLKTYDDAGTHIGHSFAPSCTSGDAVDVEVPVKNRTMKLRSVSRCIECLMPCFYMCNDEIIMNINDNTGSKIGSFEYSPAFCRCEPALCHGKYVIKNAVGEKVMYINRPRVNCMCVCYCLMDCYVYCPFTCDICDCFMSCYNLCNPITCCSPWSISSEVLDFKTDESVAHIRTISNTWLKNTFCCAKTQYRVEYNRNEESEENKALIYGTALIMDSQMLNLPLGTHLGLEKPDALI